MLMAFVNEKRYSIESKVCVIVVNGSLVFCYTPVFFLVYVMQIFLNKLF